MTEQGRKLRMCQAELEQERRLTEHLESGVTIAQRKYDDANELNKNLVEKLDEVVSHRDHLQSELLKVDELNQNLVEKNGNQFTQIKGLQEGLRAEILINSRLQKQIVTLSREFEISLKTISEMRDKSINATIEANVTNDMVAQIVSAMEGAGYPIAGYASKEAFDKLVTMVEEVEGYVVSAQGELQTAHTWLIEADATIDEIREERGE